MPFDLARGGVDVVAERRASPPANHGGWDHLTLVHGLFLHRAGRHSSSSKTIATIITKPSVSIAMSSQWIGR